jgi:hypothetical protein
MYFLYACVNYIIFSDLSSNRLQSPPAKKVHDNTCRIKTCGKVCIIIRIRARPIMKQVTYIIMLNRVIPVVLRYLLKGRRAHRTAYILGHTEIIAGRPAVDPCGNRGCISTG